MVKPPVLVSLKGSTELLFDLSEGGFSVYGCNLNTSREAPFEFQLPGDPEPLRAKAEIAWSSKLRNLTGLRFRDLREESRLRLSQWLATRLPATVPYAAEYSGPSTKSRLLQIAGTRHEMPARAGRYLLVFGFVIAGILGALVATENYRRSPASPVVTAAAGSVSAPQLHEASAQTQPQSAQTQASEHTQGTNANSPLENVSLGPALNSLDTPGLVLQVGAMVQERNADALSESLKQLGFPAIVFKHSGDRFYRVAVGPYSDRATVGRVKAQLKARNYTSLVKPWTPE